MTTSNNLLADEDDIPTIGNNDAASGDDVAVLTGTINYTLGDDALASIALSGRDGLLKLDGTAVSHGWDSGTNTLTGYGTSPADVVFTITLSSIGTTPNAANTATYTMTLLQPVKHHGQRDGGQYGAVHGGRAGERRRRQDRHHQLHGRD